MIPAIKLIALDVDGTLLRDDKTISPRVARAVRAANEIVPVMLASARPPRGLRAFHEALGLHTSQVNYNGAMSWDRSAERVLSHVRIEPTVCADVIRQARQIVSDCVVHVEHLDRWYTDRLDPRFTTETGRLFAPDFVGPLEEFAPLGATKLMLHAPPDDIRLLRDALTAAFNKAIAFTQTDDDLLQMMSVGVSKWRTLRDVAVTLGVEADAVLAIGDNENDVEMIANAGFGIAMSNGTPAARAAARRVVPSNAEDGVAVALEAFLGGSLTAAN